MEDCDDSEEERTVKGGFHYIELECTFGTKEDDGGVATVTVKTIENAVHCTALPKLGQHGLNTGLQVREAVYCIISPSWYQFKYGVHKMYGD